MRLHGIHNKINKSLRVFRYKTSPCRFVGIVLCTDAYSNRPPFPKIGRSPANKPSPHYTIYCLQCRQVLQQTATNSLRSTTREDRLSTLAIFLVEYKIAKSFDYDALIAQFAENKARKKRFE